MNEPPYTLERLGVVMEPEDDELEAWGVLNPAAARRPNGELWLLPRLVAAGNFSRIGKARVLYEGDRPTGVERLGVVLEPEEPWERNARTGGGVEDPRVTRVDELGAYVMAYAAYGPLGPRIGLATSPDLEQWTRLGPVSFAYEPVLRTDLNVYSNKDAALFPKPVVAPDGTPSYAMLHRPTWDLGWIAHGEGTSTPAGVVDARPAMWVSFCPVSGVADDIRRLARFEQHRELALPEQPWESLKIGAGPPPVRTERGWLIIYHGVSGRLEPGEDHQRAVRYSAGAMLLDLDDVTRVVARSKNPLLEPETDEERRGIVPDVVFPTGIDTRADGSADVYYGMADSRIGVARLRDAA